MLQKYTAERRRTELLTRIEEATWTVKSREAALEVARERAKGIERQIDGCRILAPMDGTVVYVPQFTGPLEVGATVRGRQRLFRIEPD